MRVQNGFLINRIGTATVSIPSRALMRNSGAHPYGCYDEKQLVPQFHSPKAYTDPVSQPSRTDDQSSSRTIRMEWYHTLDSRLSVKEKLK